MIDPVKAASRAMGVAAQLVGQRIDEAAYFGKRVVLTGEPEALASQNGQWCFLDALRLLIRVVGDLIIHLPAQSKSMEDIVRATCQETCFRSYPKIVVGCIEEHLLSASAILNVGHRARPHLPWISISSAGWIARISTNGVELTNDFSRQNPISSLFSASLGVSEVFRRLVGVSPEKFPELGLFEISVFNLEAQDMSPGPDLPVEIQVPGTLVVGAGAIGNGVALLASQLPLRGTWLVVDKQDYADENMGTCIVMENHGWVGRPKAARLSRWIEENSLLKVTGEKSLVADAIGNEACRKLQPSLLINGLDDVQARHDAQMVWPDITIDGGIGEFGVAVVQHRLDDKYLACLRCAFNLPARDHLKFQQSATGLSEMSLRDQDRILTFDDVACADPSMKDWLLARVKESKTICSVVSEATLKKLGADVAEGFRPSVPFVATAASALMLAEMVKAICFRSETYRQKSTLGNLLLGREGLGFLDQSANPNCICVVHRQAIINLRQRQA